MIADVHGHVDSLREAAGESDRLMLLGDLVDRGPDSAGVLRLEMDWIDTGRAMLVRSNHDDKLYRLLKGSKIRMTQELSETVAQIERARDAAALRSRFIRIYAETPHVRRVGRYVFAHAAVSPFHFAPPENAFSITRLRRKIESMALYGQVTGARDAEGRPVRLYDWVGQLPGHVTAIVGHDRRGDEPVVHEAPSGARAIFLDTGCGKGGPLSFVDLPTEEFGQVAV